MRLVLLLLLFPFVSFGQEHLQKGNFYISWGYNRDWYSKSDIHFQGPGYDFTIWNVPAHDAPEKFRPKLYLSPISFTIPQFNFRVGYFLNEKYTISAGWDHMKYFMTENIYANISGFLEDDAHYYYSFDLDNEPFYLYRNFLEYEHSDGFNYLRVNIDRKEHLVSWKKLGLFWNLGAGTGGAITWSDLSWGNIRYRNRPHFSGVNLSLNTGLQVNYSRHFFITSDLMAGYSWLPKVQIRHEQKDHKASQKFGFLQFYTMVGYQFKLGKK